MKPRMLLSMALATVSLVFASGCSTDSKKKSADSQEAQASRQAATVATEVGGTYYTSLEFPLGRTSLTSASKKHLNELARMASRDGREVENIKILAWADKEYPNTGKKASTAEVILAKDRAEAIRHYLERDLHSGEEIDAYNMAKRPGMLSSLFHNEEYKIKQNVEKVGATATVRDDGTLSYSKASKALVIIDYADDKNKR